MKRLATPLLIIMMLWILPVVALAVSTPISLFLNGKKILNEPVPMILNSYAYIELNTFARELGIEVDWNTSLQKATLRHGNKRLELSVGQKNASVNGKQVELVALPFMSGKYIYLPMEFIGEQLGIKMNWDALTQSLMLYQQDKKFVNTDETEELGGIEQTPLIPDQTVHGDGALSTVTGIQLINNEIRLQFNQVVRPTSFYLTEPDRYVIDLPLTQLGSALIGPGAQQAGEMNSRHPMIKSIRYAKHDESTVRFVLDLAQKVVFDLIIDDVANQLSIQWSDKSFNIVIDPGHGGKDPGADGASKAYEKHFTLALSKKIMALLEAEPNLQGYMTRTDDSHVELESRIMFANNLNADLFISIHGNTHTSLVSGTETFYWQEKSKAFATSLHKYVIEGTQLRDRGVKKEKYRLLTDDTTKGAIITMPAVLLELGYLSNAQEEKLMLTDEFQNRVAANIVKGIKQYLGL